MFSRLSVVVLIVAVSACGPAPSNDDSGVDAGTEARDSGLPPVDAGSDAGTPPEDAGVDAGAPEDAGVDAGTPDDAGIDAGTPEDAGVDAGTPIDAGVDAGTPIDAGVCVDLDGDGYGAGCALGPDCDDTAATINPAATEVCDVANVDEDCDGTADDADSSATGKTAAYADLDGDGFGAGASIGNRCDLGAQQSRSNTDCDDSAAAINPSATEVCDSANVDEDCDGAANDADSSATGRVPVYADIDGDGFGAGASTGQRCTAGMNESTNALDCNDSLTSGAAINPGATEVCDAANVDEDCDGAADDADSSATGKTPAYADLDGDTFGAGASLGNRCDLGAQQSRSNTDCDDSAASVNPAATEVCDAANVDEDCDGAADDADSSATGKVTVYRDTDNDTYGSTVVAGTRCDLLSGQSLNNLDCDDTRATVNPGATEVCDASNRDEDCDGLADDADSSATGKVAVYADADNDTFGSTTPAGNRCDPLSGQVLNNLDCNDAVASINPNAQEVCDAANVDEDCDGTADDADSSVTGQTPAFADADSDGYGAGASLGNRCDLGAQQSRSNTDCNDAAPAINPGATEVCDAADVDEDCDGLADDADSSATGKVTVYRDSDNDTYGSTVVAGTRCDLLSGQSLNNLDCDDTRASTNPGATEVCDAANRDEDCDGLADDADSSATGKVAVYTDADNDTFGSTTVAGNRCDPLSGQVLNNLDCNDAVATINPNAQEICDAANVDEDCDGLADDADSSVTGQTPAYTDGDADGYGAGTSVGNRCDLGAGQSRSNTDCNDASAAINPGATEICDATNIDQDCDGAADDLDLQGATGKQAAYSDADGDGFGSGSSIGNKCDLAANQSFDNTDCSELDKSQHVGRTAYVDKDFDGDGDLGSALVTICGLSSNLPTSGWASTNTDCNDTDPTIFFGAPEIAGDGIDQECNASGDLVVSDATGIFVNNTSGLDTNPGTRAQPVATIAKGLALSANTKPLFIAGGSYAAGNSTSVSIHGGFSPTDWTVRNDALYPTTLTIATQNPVLFVSNNATVILDQLRMVQTGTGTGGTSTVVTNNATVVIRRNNITTGTATGGNFGNLTGISSSGRLIITDSTLTVPATTSARASGIAATGRLVLLRSRVTGELDGVNLLSDPVVALDLSSATCRGAVIASYLKVNRPSTATGAIPGVVPVKLKNVNDYFPFITSTLERSGNMLFDAAVSMTASSATFVDCILQAPVGIRVAATGQPTRLAGTLFSGISTNLIDTNVQAAVVSTISALNACAWSGCIQAQSNVTGTASFTADRHLNAGSPGIDQGVDVSSWVWDPLALQDIDGQLRPRDGDANGSVLWDMGFDEF